MIIGTSMEQEIYPLHGQVSHNSHLKNEKSLQTDTCGPGRDKQNGKKHPDRIICGPKSGEV